MSLCANCRLLALRQAIRHRHLPHITNASTISRASLSTKSPASPLSSTAHDILSRPTWSVSTLFSPSDGDSPPETITPAQLHHLLRLSALPLPRTKAEEQSMLATIQSQLRFVRAVQQVNTDGVEPLQAIRDETEAATKENTITLDDLKDVLAKESHVGHYRRPKRVKEKVESAAENWDALFTASKKAGKYFVVESGKKAEQGEP